MIAVVNDVLKDTLRSTVSATVSTLMARHFFLNHEGIDTVCILTHLFILILVLQVAKTVLAGLFQHFERRAEKATH